MPDVSVTSSTVYANGSSKNSFFGFLFKKKSKTAEFMEDELEQSDVDPQTYQELESMEEEVEAIDEEVEALETVKQSVMSRFFQRIFSSSKSSFSDDNLEEISQDDIDANVASHESLVEEETKEVLRAMHKWLSKLPPEQIESFRRSEDFDRYKALLQQYGVAKK